MAKGLRNRNCAHCHPSEAVQRKLPRGVGQREEYLGAIPHRAQHRRGRLARAESKARPGSAPIHDLDVTATSQPVWDPNRDLPRARESCA